MDLERLRFAFARTLVWSRISNTPSVFRLSSRFGSDDARCTTIRMPRSTLDSPGGVYVFLILRDSSLVRQTEKKKNSSKSRKQHPIVVARYDQDSLDISIIMSISRVLCATFG